MSAFLWMHLEKRQKSFFWQAEIGSISLWSLFLKSRTNLPFSSLGFMNFSSDFADIYCENDSSFDPYLAVSLVWGMF